VAVALTVIGASLLYYEFHAHPYQVSEEGIQGPARLFDLASEANVPTWFKGVVLLFCAQMLFIVSAAKASANAPYARHWRDLGVMFVILSIDEIATIHEEVGALISDFLETTGVFLFGWVIIGLLFVFLFVFLYFYFLRSLPRMPRSLFVISGSLYVGATLGLKMVEGWYLETYGGVDLVLIALVTCKQFIQMSGGILFLYTLLVYTRYNVEESILHITD